MGFHARGQVDDLATEFMGVCRPPLFGVASGRSTGTQLGDVPEKPVIAKSPSRRCQVGPRGQRGSDTLGHRQ